MSDCLEVAISICVRVMYSEMPLTRRFISFSVIRAAGRRGLVGFSRTEAASCLFEWDV